MPQHPLIHTLATLKPTSNEEWMAKLSARKLAELDFHNRDRDRKVIENLNQDDFERFYGNKKYYSTVKRSDEYTRNWIAREAKDNVFLDYACGNGMNAIRAAQAGASLALGIDISNVSVENAKNDAQKAGVGDTTYFLQADAENTRLPDSCANRIICSGMLHHLDLSYAFPELRRILAPKGKILCIEALDYNPLIKAYRLLTPSMRTDWEKKHILKFSDLKFASRFFDVKYIKYWHVTGYLGAQLRWAAPTLDFADRILESIPIINLMSWIFTFELHSKKDAP